MSVYIILPDNEIRSLGIARRLMRSLGAGTLRTIGLERPCSGSLYTCSTNDQQLVETLQQVLGDQATVINLDEISFIP